MHILMNTLRALAYTLTEPYFLIVLVLLAIILYRKNKRTTIMQKIVIGEKVNTAFELTISQVVLGIFAGVFASIIMAYLGIFFSEDSSIELIFLVSIFFMLFNPRFICFSYSGSVLGILSILLLWISKVTNNPSLNFINIDISALMAMVAVLHFVEAILVMIDGDKGYIPVFSNRNDRIIGGFALQRYWVIPIALFIMLNSNEAASFLSSGTPMPNWWPLVNTSVPKSILNAAVVSLIPFYGVIGYKSVTFTESKKDKAIRSGVFIMMYSITLFILSQLANFNIFFKLLVLVFAPLAHEFMLKFQKNIELNKEPKYISSKDGIMVLDVAENSIAKKMGIKSGDLLIEINNEIINNEEDILKSIKQMYGHISLKVKNQMGNLNTLSYDSVGSYERLGIVLVPKALPKTDSIIKIDNTKFKDVLNNIKNKDKDE
ncbi:PDZ domain-containing protein [Clostridium oceanicum]|uniref:S1C family serine protease n=1 Tax=Clostridium oceanicum TaxID=1543 RepID=A0ABN1JAY1_9CLOT